MDKKLYKSNDRVLAGVCGGIAEYFGFEPSTLRLIWALAILLAGAGIVAYIVLALLMPKRSDFI